jgi:uncharacterized BrkB/YihY/UPF0761 family membrane protein
VTTPGASRSPSLWRSLPGRWQRLGRAIEHFVLRLLAHNAFETAAAVAFWFFLSLVPLMVLAGYLVGQVARTRGVDDLVGPLLDVVPESAEALIRTELERLAGARGATVAPLGVLGFLWTASSGIHNLMDVCEATVSVQRRPWWKQRAMSVGWVAAGLAVACFLAWFIVAADRAWRAGDTQAWLTPAVAPADKPRSLPLLPELPVNLSPRSARLAEHAPDRSPRGAPAPGAAAPPAGPPHARPAPPPGGTGSASAAPSSSVSAPGSPASARRARPLRGTRTTAFATVLLLVTGLLMLAGFYWLAVDHPPGVKRRVWPGAAAAIVSWLVVSWGFGEYTLSIGDNYALYYGSLAAVAVLLVWLYLTSLALVIGAEVNAELEGSR